MGERVARFKGRDDALGPAGELEGVQRLLIRRAHIFDAAGLVEPGMSGADAGVIEPGRERTALLDLPISVLKQMRAVADEHARPAAAKRGRMHEPAIPAAAVCRTD